MASFGGFFGGLWRKVVKPVVTLGLPILIRKIVAKNPRSDAIAIGGAIIEGILAKRPDLHDSPQLYDYARAIVKQSADLSNHDKRDVLRVIRLKTQLRP